MVRVKDCITNDYLQGECSGVLVNISKEGACIVLQKMLISGNHLFFTTLNDERHCLVLSIDTPMEKVKPLMVMASPVWMDGCHYNEQPAFKVGLCFQEKQHELFSFFKENKKL